jgi:isopentenyl diphosphate isomerase/L-lactate dehydrogenase-like FMN-dependent dehydrogenase
MADTTTPRPTALAYPPPSAPPIGLEKIVSLHDFEAPARERLHPAAWEYYQGGAWDGTSLRDNLAAFDRWWLRPRVLRDVSEISIGTTILGRPAASPLGISPAALHGMAHADGELATVRAGGAAGVVTVVSTVASNPIESIAAAAPDARKWFQLYYQRDPGFSRRLVERAAAAGFEALVLTVDVPVLAYRDNLLRMPFDPGEDAYANLPKRDAFRKGDELDEVLDLRGVPLTWDLLDEIRSWAPLPLVLKGILTPEDARIAVDHGVDAVWVSNHGGRQLDRSVSALDVLPEIVDAVEGRTEIYLDGGIRRGPDVLIALALGANAVFTARPFLYALACAGEAGISRGLHLMAEEIERSMGLLGVKSISELSRDYVTRAAAQIERGGGPSYQ